MLRPGGTLSVLAAHRNAAVVARTVAGRFAEARHALTDPDGRWGPGDPLPRRFTEAGLLAVLGAAGLEVGSVHGVRTLADLAPATDSEADPAEELVRPRAGDGRPAGVPGGGDPAARARLPGLSSARHRWERWTWRESTAR